MNPDDPGKASTADEASRRAAEPPSDLERARRNLISRRLPYFAVAWLGMLAVWAAVLVIESRAALFAVALTFGLQIAVLAAVVTVCRKEPLARRVVPLTLLACLLLGLCSLALFATLGEHAEVAALVSLTLCLAAAVVFAWGWRIELVLVAVTVTALVLGFYPQGLSISMFDFAASLVIGSALSLALAQISRRNFSLAFVQRQSEGKALRALEESRNAYRDLAENAPDFIYVHDREGIFKYVNLALARFLGEPASALIGRSYRSILSDNPANPDVPSLIERLEAGQKVAPQQLEVRVGEALRWIECRVAVVRGADGRVVEVRGTAHDVTERKRVEDALRLSEERFRSAFNSAAIGVAIMAPDRRFLQVNASFCSIFGYAERELLAMTLDAVTDPADLAVSLAGLERLLTGKASSLQTETRYRHRLGHAVWCSVSGALAVGPTGEPGRLVLQAQDVSARKHVEAALRESEARYRGLVESQNDLVIRSDLDNRLTFVNDAFCKQFGQRRDQILGESFLAPVCEEDIATVVAAIQEVVIPPHRATVEVRVLTPDGIRWISWEGCAIKDERGMVVEIQAEGKDVTERREAEDTMRSLLEDLRRSEERLRLLAQRQTQIREEERKRLGLDLHDDVCQDLVGIGILIQAVRSKLPPVAAETSAEFDRVVKYLGNVVEHLRLLAHDLRPMQLVDLGLEASLRVLVKGMTSPNTEVRAEFSKPFARLEEEVEVALYRIAQEALSNAVRHAAARTVVLRLETDDAVARLEVRDDGCGFVPEARSGAEAIGLVSMRERATALGGRIEVWSEPGKGTAVRLECPIAVRAQLSSAYRRPA